MKLNGTFLIGILLLCSHCSSLSELEKKQKAGKEIVAGTPGLIAFWDFENLYDKVWRSYYDKNTIDRSFPLYLRQIGDNKNYSTGDWPHADPDSRLIYDRSGPFGNAVRFNRGYIYGAVPRESFDGTLLDLHGRQAFTLIAWMKFTGKRHMVAGIWDEGGWEKYSGRRQVALFGGLFSQKGLIAHISATGASSYPQSEIPGSQYARVRAIDGQGFEDGQWVMMAMSYDPEKAEVSASLNGKMTPLEKTDPIAQDVFRYPKPQPANPLPFAGPIFSPLSFILKFNGYSLEKDGISEHRLLVDLKEGKISYEQEGTRARSPERSFRLTFGLTRGEKRILPKPVVLEAVHGQTVSLLLSEKVKAGDEVITSLEVLENGRWTQVGSQIRKKIREGAPFTFGRALGLASEEIEHGSDLYLDGVAVFNRVLPMEELRRLSLISAR